MNAQYGAKQRQRKQLNRLQESESLTRLKSKVMKMGGPVHSVKARGLAQDKQLGLISYQNASLHCGPDLKIKQDCYYSLL